MHLYIDEGVGLRVKYILNKINIFREIFYEIIYYEIVAFVIFYVHIGREKWLRT